MEQTYFRTIIVIRYVWQDDRGKSPSDDLTTLAGWIEIVDSVAQAVDQRMRFATKRKSPRILSSSVSAIWHTVTEQCWLLRLSAAEIGTVSEVYGSEIPEIEVGDNGVYFRAIRDSVSSDATSPVIR